MYQIEISQNFHKKPLVFPNVTLNIKIGWYRHATGNVLSEIVFEMQYSLVFLDCSIINFNCSD